ncbi:hypothetical protein RI054_44g152530 [Pseudoscourfieldia marina]
MGDNGTLLAHDERMQQLAEVAAANGTAPSATIPHKEEDSEDEEADANNSWTEEEDLQLVTAMEKRGLHSIQDKTGIKARFKELRDDSEFKVTLRPQTSFEGFYKRAGRLKERPEYYDKLLRQVREEKAKKTNRYVWDDGEESLLIDAHLSYIKKLQIQYAKPPDLKMTEECWRHVLLDVKGDPKFKVFFDRSRTPKAMETRWREIRQRAQAQGCYVAATNALHQANTQQTAFTGDPKLQKPAEHAEANVHSGAGPSAPASGTLQPRYGGTNDGTLRIHGNAAFDDVSRIESIVAEQVVKRMREVEVERNAVKKQRLAVVQTLRQKLRSKEHEEKEIERKISAAPQTQNDLNAVIRKADAELAQIRGDLPVVNETMEKEGLRKSEAEEAEEAVQKEIGAERQDVVDAQTQLAKSREVLANTESRKQEAQTERKRTLQELWTAKANYDRACAAGKSAMIETDNASKLVAVDEQMVSQAQAKVAANADARQARLDQAQSKRKEAQLRHQAAQTQWDGLQEKLSVAEKKKQDADEERTRNSPEELTKELNKVKSEIELLQQEKDDVIDMMAIDP